MNITRRNIIGGLAAFPILHRLNFAPKNSAEAAIPEGLTILFQGDSITDGGRNRGAYYPNHGQGMGQGYVRHIVTSLLGRHPQKQMNFYNRGISGNKVYQLRDRWKDDCIQLQPDVISILIGVNDFWHTLTNNYRGTVTTYRDDLKALLDETMTSLPEALLILGEPFVLHDGTAIDSNKWKGKFEMYQLAARDIAQEYEAKFIPYQALFDAALREGPVSYWCPDGVHPSMAGNYVMAGAWIRTFEELFI